MKQASSSGWRFWASWMVAFVGFPLGGIAAAALAGPITTPLGGALGGLATGAVIGTAEWLVLRRHANLTGVWIVATALGMSAGLALGVALLGTSTDGFALQLRGLITGLCIGGAQYLLLRGASARAPAWLLVVGLGWALGWTLTRAVGVDLRLQWSVFGSAGAIMFQLLTGLALSWMLQRRQVASGAAAILPYS